MNVSKRNIITVASIVLILVATFVALPKNVKADTASTIANPISFTDTFDNGFTNGWTSSDEGSVKGPSKWKVTNQQLTQTSLIQGASTSPAVKQAGTEFTAGNAAWSNYDYNVTMTNTGTGDSGIVFRYVDGHDFYRLSINKELGYINLTKDVKGTYTLLGQSGYTSAMGTTFQIRALVVGSNMQIFINNAHNVNDTKFPTGKIGLYTSRSSTTTFDNVNATVEDDTSFSIAVLPDTQFESKSYLSMFTDQTKWIADNRGADNIVMTLHEGDVVDDMTSPTQWKNAATGMSYLEGKVPFVVAAGNHDIENYQLYSKPIYPTDPTQFNAFASGLTGYTPDGFFKAGDYMNTYQLFSAGGVNFLVLNLQFGAPDDVLTWAGQIADEYSNRHAILLTHDYLNQKNVLRGSKSGDRSLPSTYNPTLNDGIDIWNKFVKTHPNVQFTFNGHVNQTIDKSHPYSVGRLVSTDDAGRSVFQTLTNFQSDDPGGRGYMRIFHFYPSAHKVTVETYSPYEKNSLTSSLNKFTYSNVDLSQWQ